MLTYKASFNLLFVHMHDAAVGFRCVQPQRTLLLKINVA